jgi:prolipoprotein diacylglyceryltransferase
MYRILLEWRGIRIYAYPAMLYLGMVFGVVGGAYTAGLHGLAPARVYGVMLLLLLPALVGARLLFVLSHWSLYRREPSRILKRSDGGAALYGGLLVSFLVSLPILSVMDISIAAFWDATAVAMLIGMIPTKVGCLLNGCCAGRPTTSALGLSLPNAQGVWRRRLPAQPLEAALAVLLLVVSFTVWNRFPIDGVQFLTALLGYGMGRWWLESMRESADMIGPLRLHGLISVVLSALSTVGLVLIWFHRS